jgi:predicted dehydrogenase
MAPIKVSIIGTGGALEFLHYPSIISLPSKFTIHSVLERTPRGRVQEVCGEGVKVVRTLEDIVNDSEVQLVSQRICRISAELTRVGCSRQC